jgi:hypothetical protein
MKTHPYRGWGTLRGESHRTYQDPESTERTATNPRILPSWVASHCATEVAETYRWLQANVGNLALKVRHKAQDTG